MVIPFYVAAVILMREEWFDSLIMKVTIRKLESDIPHDHD
jgi:hypothetical protein